MGERVAAAIENHHAGYTLRGHVFPGQFIIHADPFLGQKMAERPGGIVELL